MGTARKCQCWYVTNNVVLISDHIIVHIMNCCLTCCRQSARRDWTWNSNWSLPWPESVAVVAEDHRPNNAFVFDPVCLLANSFLPFPPDVRPLKNLTQCWSTLLHHVNKITPFQQLQTFRGKTSQNRDRAQATHCLHLLANAHCLMVVRGGVSRKVVYKFEMVSNGSYSD